MNQILRPLIFLCCTIYFPVYMIAQDVDMTTVPSTNASSERYDASIWDKIDLTSPRMKKKRKAFPWWIPATVVGGGTVAGVILVTNQEKDTSTTPLPIAVDDSFSLPCGQDNTISPLSNDIGEGIRIQDVTGAPPGSIMFTDLSITVLRDLNEDIKIIYTIVDRFGQMASASIQITFVFPNLSLVDQEGAVEADEFLSGNVFDGANCEGCLVQQATAEPFLAFEWTPQGDYALTAHQVQEKEVFILRFQVEDRCGQTGHVLVTILVLPPCTIDPEFIVTHEDCDFENGGVQTVLENLESYEFSWSNGTNQSSLNDVPSGDYSVTITDSGNTNCSIDFSVEIPNNEFPTVINDESFTTDFNVEISGNVLDNDEGTALRISNFSPLDVVNFNISEDGSFVFLAGEGTQKIFVSEYTVIDTCGRSSAGQIQFNVNRPPCDLVAFVELTQADCGKNNGSAALSIIPPDGDYAILWSNGQTGLFQSELGMGSYNVLVRDNSLDCEIVVDFEISELSPFNYGNLLNVSGSSCLGDGEITLFMESLMGMPVSLVISKDGEPLGDFELQTGLIDLSELLIIAPGTYDLTFLEGDLPTRCAQSLSVLIDEVDLMLEVIDDNYSIFNDEVWSGNVLENDIGTGLKVVDFTKPMDGVLNLDPTGNGTFQPSSGFEGVIVFEYTVQDTCGQEAIGIVTITVQDRPCIFTAEITTVKADCGAENGTASVMILPEGPDYIVSWPNGGMGLTTAGLATGAYQVGIFDPFSNCTILFPFEILENPIPEYIVSVNSDVATCLGEGDIELVLFNPNAQPMTVEVMRNGEFITSIQLENGTHNLSSHLNIFAGNYMLVTYETNRPPSCSFAVGIEVGFQEFPLQAINDEYTILQGEIWSGNVMANDIGMGLMVVDFTNPSEGTLILNPNGSGLYNPGQGFFGVVTFNYTIQDVCGNLSTAMVTITVEERPCDFIAEIMTVPADCGVSNGSATVNVFPEQQSYIITWPNGQTGINASGLASGSYQLAIFDPELDCTLFFPFDIEENDVPEFIQDISSFPATCLDGGEILLTLNHPLGDQMIVEIQLEGVLIAALELNSGTNSLSSFISIASGLYTFVVYAANSNVDCSVNGQVNVDVIDLPMQVMDDFVTLPFGESWTGNVLDNDIGIDLMTADFTLPGSGNLDLDVEGNATFIPDPGFSGIVTFFYTAVDVCGQLQTAEVQIVVEETFCDYTVSFEVTPSGCGLFDGEVVATVFPEDGSILQWSNGQSGLVMSGVGAGTYTLTISNLTAGCSQEFSVEVPEDSPDFLVASEVIPASCNQTALIILELDGSGSFEISAVGPDGEGFELNAGNGIVVLGEDFLSPGLWIVSIIDLMAGPQCIISVSFEIEEYFPVILSAMVISPPSNSDMNDGVVLVNLEGGNPPYTVTDGFIFWGPLEPGSHELSGFTVGIYELIAFDNNDCPSEVVVVIFEVEDGLSNQPIIQIESYYAGTDILSLNVLDQFFGISTLERSGHLSLSQLQTISISQVFRYSAVLHLPANTFLSIDYSMVNGNSMDNLTGQAGKWSAQSFIPQVGQQLKLWERADLRLSSGGGGVWFEEYRGISNHENFVNIFRTRADFRLALGKQTSYSICANLDYIPQMKNSIFGIQNSFVFNW